MAKSALTEILDNLTRARDEARVRAHLLSMEARERWSELETKIEDIQDSAKVRGESSLEEAKELARTVEEFVKRNLSGSSGAGAPH
jgi:hypothetical protein